jgi:hypothetical protein
MMVDAAVSAAERLQASGGPQWHRVFTETLQRLHQSKPRTHVLAADDPWIVALEQALGAMEGRISINDVWKLLQLSPLCADKGIAVRERATPSREGPREAMGRAARKWQLRRCMEPMECRNAPAERLEQVPRRPGPK